MTRGVDPELAARAREDLASIRRSPWYEEGRWNVSAHNFTDAGRPLAAIPDDVTLVDLTGRVIEQIDGLALTTEEKVELLRAVADAGIRQIHAALRIHASDTPSVIEMIHAIAPAVEIVTLVYSMEDIERAAAVGCSIVEVNHRSRPSLQLAPGTPQELLERTAKRIRAARKLGLRVRSDLNLVGYVDQDHLRRFASTVAEAGAEYLQLADSASSLGPRALMRLISIAKDAAPSVQIGLHLHNDLGLALANAVAGLEAGAEQFDVSVNGLGERAGQLDLAQFAVVLRVLYGLDVGVQFEKLGALSDLVERLSGMRVPAYFPLVGEFAFSTAVESVLMHEEAVDHLMHMPIAPGFVGATRRAPIGRNTGAFGLRQRLGEIDRTIDDDAVAPALARIDAWLVEHKRPLTGEELLSLVDQERQASPR